MRLLILRVILFRQGLLPGISNHLQTETNPFRKGTDRKSVVEDALGVPIILLITYRAKLLSADWLTQRAFFLNHEGTFGNQERMIT